MICKLTDDFEIRKFPQESIYLVRIASLASVYGFSHDFAAFFAQYTNGACTAVISYLDGSATLAALDSADFEELSMFFSAKGFSSLLCSADFDSFQSYETGVIMSARGGAKYSGGARLAEDYETLMRVFELSGAPGDFKCWYADIKRRISRHGALCAVSFSGNTVASCAVFSNIENGGAVLSCVATAPEFRGRGLASDCVRLLLSEASQTVYLMREDSKNESFYTKLGFKNTGRWRMYQ